jgi:hypothetical protein
MIEQMRKLMSDCVSPFNERLVPRDEHDALGPFQETLHLTVPLQPRITRLSNGELLAFVDSNAERRAQLTDVGRDNISPRERAARFLFL